MYWFVRWFLVVPLMFIVGLAILLVAFISFGLQTLFRVESNERLDFYSWRP